MSDLYDYKTVTWFYKKHPRTWLKLLSRCLVLDYGQVNVRIRRSGLLRLQVLSETAILPSVYSLCTSAWMRWMDCFWTLQESNSLTQWSILFVCVFFFTEVEGHEGRKGTHRIHLFLDSDNHRTPGLWMWSAPEAQTARSPNLYLGSCHVSSHSQTCNWSI